MAIKDFSISEDTEHKKSAGIDVPSSSQTVEKGASSQIKNAHATGDGSFGRNDESLPDEGETEGKEKVEKDGNVY